MKSKTIPSIEFEKFILPNGLQLILHVDRKLPVVHVNQWFHVGSKNEKRGRTGFAHLFEHIMFQGSKHASSDYFTYVERAGANLREGGVNGTTDFDRTNYFATVPSGNLEFLLWVESDRLATLAEALTLDKLDTQRDVVRNEFRQSLENVPYGRAFMILTENLHPQGHPYSWDVIGSHEDLIASSLDDVKDFFNRFYAPNNLTLVIAGDFDPAEAKRLVEQYFGPIPPGPALTRPVQWVPRLDGRKVIAVGDRVPQERTYIAWPAPPYFHDDEAALDMASRILTDGLTARLSKLLVYDRQICTDVSAFNQALEISGMFGVIATARPGASLEEIETLIFEEVVRLGEKSPAADEVERARTKWEFDFVSALERIGGFGGKADRLAQYNTYLGDPARFEADGQRYRNVSAEDVSAAVKRWLSPEQNLTVRFHPEEAARSEGQAALDRSSIPALGADRPFKAPEVESGTLPNGLDVLVVSRHDLPKVAVSIVTLAGAVSDPAGKAGTANFAVSTMKLGTSRHNALELEDALGDLGTSIDGFASREYSLQSMDVLERNLPAALELFADVVQRPTFPSEEVERERAQHLDALSQQANNPGAVAARVRSMLAFGHDHPYGRPLLGLPDSMQAISADDLQRFHSENWRPASSALIFAGDITLEDAMSLAARYFGQWSGGPVVELEQQPARPAETGRIYLVDRQDAPQTVVAEIVPGPSRAGDDYYSFRILDAIWGGGGFGTRLNLNLREDKGYSYGVFSNVAAFRKAGLWWAQGSVQTDKTGESLVEFIRELEELAEKRPITEAEFSDARERRLRGYSQQFESLSRIAAQVADLWVWKLPMNELQREYDAISTGTLAEVRDSARRYATPDSAILLLVGDRSIIEPALRGLDVGEIVVLDVEGRRV